MNNNIFEFNENLDLLFSSNIEVISVSANEKMMNNKFYYLYDNDYHKVEDFASMFFRDNNYEVYKGVEISQVFNFMIGIEQFEKHFIRNSESKNNILKSEVILDRIKTIKKLKIDLIENNIFHIKLLDYSESLLDLYYNYSENKIINNNLIFNVLRRLKESEISKLFIFYEQISGLNRGTPDLFILKDKSFHFVEVKSKNDSLSRHQIFFINKFKKYVSDNIFVLHVQTNDWN